MTAWVSGVMRRRRGRADGAWRARRGLLRHRRPPGPAAIAGSLPTNYGPAEQTTLNVGVVPAMDSAGFFVALNQGLFTREGLKINYSPATSSETAIQQQGRASSRSRG